jgi:NAD(P)-dependent dehydrogenase (short-subunit alcohol dehydrogenase family)
MANLRFAAAKERRAACITGGARGLGRAAALRIAQEGRDVAILDLLQDEAEKTVSEIEALGQRALFVKTDITDQLQVQAAIDQAAEDFGRLDILVCCAGILGWEKPFLEQTPEQFAKVMNINVHGVYHAHQAAIPHMLKGGWGRCVTITSGARRGSPNQVPYSVSKGAVFSFVQALGCLA